MRSGFSIAGPSPWTKSKRNAHRLERQQQVGEEDGRVDFDAAHRLERDFGREIGRATDIEQRIALAQRAVLGSCSGRPAA